VPATQSFLATSKTFFPIGGLMSFSSGRTSGTTSLSYKATLEVLKEFFREAKVDQHGPKPEAELMVAQEFHT
jgi:hypothetical protein